MPLPDAFRPLSTRPAIVGHRGVRGPAPENTLRAIREAKAQGADAIEVDARVCKTGECYVLHDPDLARVAGDPRLADQLSYADLKSIDVGEGERPPLLADVVELARELGLGVNVELKHDVTDRVALARAAARVLRDARGVDIVVSSFDPALLVTHKALMPRLCHALLVHESTYHDWAIRIARALPVDGVHMQSSVAVPVRVAPMVERAFVNVWTVNRASEAKRLAELGVSALITDQPKEIAAVFARGSV